MKSSVLHPKSDSRNWPRSSEWPIYAVKTDFVSQVYIIRTELHDQNKNTVGAKTRSLWELMFALFLLPKRFAVNWKTRRNATRLFL